MIEKPSPLVSDPVFIRGWNAAISHAEDYLVSLAYSAGNTAGVPKTYTSMSSFSQRIMMAAAEKIGRARRPVPLHHG